MSVIKASRLNTYQTKTTGKHSWPLFCPLIQRPRTKEKLRPDLTSNTIQFKATLNNSESLQTGQHLFMPSVTRWRTQKSNRVLPIFLGKTIVARSQFWIFFFPFLNNASYYTSSKTWSNADSSTAPSFLLYNNPSMLSRVTQEQTLYPQIPVHGMFRTAFSQPIENLHRELVHM